ncbi:MAG TPA: manganese efflux pump [Bacteroidales bacterium]|nr:manganese efflux pump [Bacteroidales bacterium]HNQ83756.1 manganese efflux pump [Bacteroidales bacterium]HOX78943.1 manganese efflux pump [Bacteroidales bacterium]HPI86796.1 manganese efflux pump [Bacteroidales bacterium]HPM93787.1 manganese efflux pump [Bacteroidales bacterium]
MPYTILLFPLIISFIPLSVAVSTSIYRCVEWKEAFRTAIVFALFQAAMMTIGWAIGYGVKGMLYSMAVPIGAVIVFFIGIRLMFDSRRLTRENRIMAVENRRILIGFALVSSINTALLGMGLGLLYPDILFLAAPVFGFTFLGVVAGVQAGKRGMVNLGRNLELLGSLGLIIASIIIALQHLRIL